MPQIRFRVALAEHSIGVRLGLEFDEHRICIRSLVVLGWLTLERARKVRTGEPSPKPSEEPYHLFQLLLLTKVNV